MRFVYATNKDPMGRFMDLLIDFNKSWAKNAGMLVISLPENALRIMRNLRDHSFDTGAAWMSLSIEGTLGTLSLTACKASIMQKPLKSQNYRMTSK